MISCYYSLIMGDTDGMLTNARAAKNIPVYTDKSLIIAGKSVAEIEGAIFEFEEWSKRSGAFPSAASLRGCRGDVCDAQTRYYQAAVTKGRLAVATSTPNDRNRLNSRRVRRPRSAGAHRSRRVSARSGRLADERIAHDCCFRSPFPQL